MSILIWSGFLWLPASGSNVWNNMFLPEQPNPGLQSLAAPAPALHLSGLTIVVWATVRSAASLQLFEQDAAQCQVSCYVALLKLFRATLLICAPVSPITKNMCGCTLSHPDNVIQGVLQRVRLVVLQWVRLVVLKRWTILVLWFWYRPKRRWMLSHSY